MNSPHFNELFVMKHFAWKIVAKHQKILGRAPKKMLAIG